MLCGFAPWIVYWVLVGNGPFAVAALIALAVAVGALAMAAVSGRTWHSLETGSAAVFLVLTVLTLGIAWSRLALAAHYPTDVIGGSVLGFAVAIGIALLRHALPYAGGKSGRHS